MTYTLGPWLERWQQRINLDLLLEEERDQYFVEFLPAALVRGDLKTRYEAYSIGRNGGWLSVNDIRDMENLNRIEEGDQYLTPLNMQDAASTPAKEAEEDAEE